MTVPQSEARYYPTKEDMKDPERMFQVITRAFDGINSAHDQLAEQPGKSTGAVTSGGASKGKPPAATASPTSPMPTSLGPTQPPASSSAQGLPGSVTWDSGFLYVCTAANQWKRIALVSF